MTRRRRRPVRSPGALETVFYDGTCGLCHSLVRFVLQRSPDDPRLLFAPLGGETFRKEVPEALRASLPDSVVVHTERGELKTRAAAVLHLFERLGGVWKVLAWLVRPVPRFLLDFLYDVVARARRRFFPAPPSSCPVPSENQRDRFLP